MFKFLFGRKGAAGATAETQRQTIERALGEINEIVDQMAEKPKVTVDMSTGALGLDLPDQMPDEALALPAPDAAEADAAEDSPDSAQKAPESEKAAA